MPTCRHKEAACHSVGLSSQMNAVIACVLHEWPWWTEINHAAFSSRLLCASLFLSPFASHASFIFAFTEIYLCQSEAPSVWSSSVVFFNCCFQPLFWNHWSALSSVHLMPYSQVKTHELDYWRTLVTCPEYHEPRACVTYANCRQMKRNAVFNHCIFP